VWTDWEQVLRSTRPCRQVNHPKCALVLVDLGSPVLAGATGSWTGPVVGGHPPGEPVTWFRPWGGRAGAHLDQPTSGEGGRGAPPCRPPPSPVPGSHPCVPGPIHFPERAGGGVTWRVAVGQASFSPQARSVRPIHAAALGANSWSAARRAWHRDEGRKREGEERAPLPALTLAAPPTLRVLGRGRAGPTRPDGRDGAGGLCKFLGARLPPGDACLRVAPSQHLLHRYGVRASGTVDQREGAAEGGWTQFSAAQEAGEQGAEGGRAQRLGTSGSNTGGRPLCASVRGPPAI
jgi:hypothetical protein